MPHPLLCGVNYCVRKRHLGSFWSYLCISNLFKGNSSPSNILIFILNVTSVFFLTAGFNLFRCEYDGSTFHLLYSIIYILIQQDFCCSFIKFNCCFFLLLKDIIYPGFYVYGFSKYNLFNSSLISILYFLFATSAAINF